MQARGRMDILATLLSALLFALLTTLMSSIIPTLLYYKIQLKKWEMNTRISKKVKHMVHKIFCHM
jgi:uncharacterized membrane protein YciS (DUF1049 family)